MSAWGRPCYGVEVLLTEWSGFSDLHGVFLLDTFIYLDQDDKSGNTKTDI